MQVAVFDLDGTITRHDTLLPFVLGVCLRRPLRLPRVLGRMPRALLHYAFGGRDRGQLKEALIVSGLGGFSRTDLATWSEQFVRSLVPQGMHQEALACIAEHRRRGDHLVLMSASPDVYVPVIARHLGFAETICTGVRWNGMVLSGELVTPNRRGEEKVRSVHGLRQRYPGRKIVAYGNSASDVPHMALCDNSHLVNGDPEAVREAVHHNVNIGWPHFATGLTPISSMTKRS